MTGRKATPLPIGWTPIEDEYSPFVRCTGYHNIVKSVQYAAELMGGTK